MTAVTAPSTVGQSDTLTDILFSKTFITGLCETMLTFNLNNLAK